MIETIPKLLSFEEFLDWKPENGRYELHQGVIFEMQPTGKHEEIAAFLATEITIFFRQQNFSYFLSNHALVKPPSKDSGYLPDVLVVNRHALENEPLWNKASTLTKGASIPLVIEVVSTNWRDDYLHKLSDYEEMGIPEYWIVDYLGLGGSRYIGSPKQPTISVYRLVEEEYQVCQFKENQRVESFIFPELNLTAAQILAG